MKKILLLLSLLTLSLNANEVIQFPYSDIEVLKLSSEKIFINKKDGLGFLDEKKVAEKVKSTFCQFDEMKNFLKEGNKLSSLIITDKSYILINLKNCNLSQPALVSQVEIDKEHQSTNIQIEDSVYHLYNGKSYNIVASGEGVYKGFVKGLCSKSNFKEIINNGADFTYIYFTIDSYIVIKVDKCD